MWRSLMGRSAAESAATFINSSNVAARLVQTGWPFLVLAAATLAFYWEIVLPYRILADYDVWAYFYPLRSYAADAIRAGRFPLWNPDTFLGAPFFANPQTALVYPGTLLFYALPVAYAFSLSVIFHAFFAAVGMYLFLGRSVEIPRLPAVEPPRPEQPRRRAFRPRSCSRRPCRPGRE